MKIIYSLPEYLRLVVSFNSETQLGMQAAEPVLEEFENILFHNQLPDWNGNEALRISIDAEFRGSLGFRCFAGSVERLIVARDSNEHSEVRAFPRHGRRNPCTLLRLFHGPGVGRATPIFLANIPHELEPKINERVGVIARKQDNEQ
jgi:hypothetical protein